MNKILLIAFVSALLIAGCKKDKANNITSSKIKTEIHNNYGHPDTTLHFYDSRERLIYNQYFSPTAFDTFTYYTDSIIIHSGNARGIYYLNSQGYATNLIQKYGNLITFDRSFSYDAEGHLIAQTDNLNGGNYAWTWSQGNIIMKSHNGAVTDSFAYYTSKINTISNQNRGQSFLGVSSKNLVDIQYWKTPVRTFFNSYTFDQMDRVIQIQTDTFPPEYYTYY